MALSARSLPRTFSYASHIVQNFLLCVDFKIINISLAASLLAEAVGEDSLALDHLLLLEAVNNLSLHMLGPLLSDVAPLHHHQHDRFGVRRSFVLVHVFSQTDLECKLFSAQFAGLVFGARVHGLGVLFKSIRLLEDLVTMCALELAMLLVGHVFHLNSQN